MEFVFYYDNENYQKGYEWQVVNKMPDFSDTAKDGAKFLFDKLTEQ